MTTPVFVDAFRALHTAAARRDALQALTNELSPYEWRQLQALANAKSFQFDIVGALPAELAFHVFSHLDTAAIFRLQAVSRRWCHLLRSPVFLKPTLREWYDHTVDFENATYQDCHREAQVIHRVQTGRFSQLSASKPISHLHPDATGPDSPIGIGRLCLEGDFLVDSPFPFRHLRVTNLQTGQDWRACADGRESISRINASDQLIAFWTSSRRTCYVFDYKGTRKAKFQLPPFMNKIATCRGRTVVCGGTVDGCLELYIWDLDSNKGKSLRLEQSLFNRDRIPDNCLALSLVPDPGAKTLTLFTTRTCEYRWCGHHVEDLSISYYNITFDGLVLQQKSFTVPLPGEASNLAGATITSIKPVDRKGGYLIKVFCRYNHDSHMCSIRFDEKLQMAKMAEHLTQTNECTKTACWKDSYYRVEEHTEEWLVGRGDGRMHISLMHLGTSGECGKLKDPIFIDEAEMISLMGGSYIQLLINDKFLVLRALDRTYVFSFAAEAATAESIESGSDDEQQGKLVLWKIDAKIVP